MAKDYSSLLNAIDRAEETAYGSDEKGELSRERARAIDFYMGRNTRPAPEGRSQVVDRSTFETINWILPSIVDIFANGEDVISMPPVGPEDEEGAKQEAQYLNHVMLNKNPWLEVILSLAVDCFLTKNAYVYVYKDYKRNVEIDQYEKQTATSLQMLMEDKGAEIIAQKEYPDPDVAMEPVIGPDGQPQMQVVGIDPMGQPIMQPAMQPVMLYDVTIRRVETEGKYCIDVLPPERCKVSERTPTFRLKDCPYFEYWAETTISDLRKRGFDVPDDINDMSSEDTEEDQARDQYNESNEDTYQGDPASRLVKVRTIWIEHDTDEDGIAEMQRVLLVGRTVLEHQEVGRIHVASTVPIPLPHRHMGMSIADITNDLQEIKTAILRGGLDNLYLSNNSRVAVSNKANIDDVLLSRPGQPIRVDTDMADVQGHVIPLVAPFIFPQAMEGLEYMDQVKENRTGTSRYFTGIDQNSLNKTASGQSQLITMAAQRVKLMARIFGCCIEDIASILHEVILKSGHRKEVVQLRGKWVDVNPGEWRRRTDFKVEVAYAAGNKDALTQKLMIMAQKQAEALAGGLPIVTPENLYNTGMELAKAMDFPNGDKFFTDPKKIPPKEPQPDVTVMAMETLKAQSAERIKGAELAQKDRETAEDNALQKYIADQNNQVKLIIAQAQAENAKEMEGVKVQGQARLKEHEDFLKNKPVLEKKEDVDSIVKMLQETIENVQSTMQAVVNSKRKIRRGKDGKAAFVDIETPDGQIIASQKVVRGPDNKIVGAE